MEFEDLQAIWDTQNDKRCSMRGCWWRWRAALAAGIDARGSGRRYGSLTARK